MAWTANPICFKLFWHLRRAAASRTFWTAGSRGSDENRDNRDHYQQLNKGERGEKADPCGTPRGEI